MYPIRVTTGGNKAETKLILKIILELQKNYTETATGELIFRICFNKSNIRRLNTVFTQMEDI